jgi:hypothetical protein
MVPGLDSDSSYVGVVRLLGGGLAGITAASVTYPLDVVRTRLAAQVMSCVTTLPTYQFNISLVFYLSSFALCCFMDQCFATLHFLFLKLLNNVIFSAHYIFLSKQKTTRYYNGIFHTVSTICRDEGAKGLYKGLGATLLVGHEPFTDIRYFKLGCQ